MENKLHQACSVFNPRTHNLIVIPLNVISLCFSSLETGWDYKAKRQHGSLNLHPSPVLMSKAYKAMVESFRWKTLTVLYQDDRSLLRLQELLMSPLDSDAKIVLRKLDFSEGADNGMILSEVKHSGAMHMVLDCDLDKIREVLSKAKEVGLVTAYHSFLITTLDLHIVDLENFKESGVNITALRLVDPRSPNMIAAFKADKRVCASCKQTHDSTLDF